MPLLQIKHQGQFCSILIDALYNVVFTHSKRVVPVLVREIILSPTDNFTRSSLLAQSF